jgi:hypothetical protein
VTTEVSLLLVGAASLRRRVLAVLDSLLELGELAPLLGFADLRRNVRALSAATGFGAGDAVVSADQLDGRLSWAGGITKRSTGQRPSRV